MINFETVIPFLTEMFLVKLPNYIEEINKEKNDGLIIKSFENKELFEKCQRLPCFLLELLESDYSEKDRIVENTVFRLNMEIKTKVEGYKRMIEVLRYEQSLEKMFAGNLDNNISLCVENIKGRNIVIKITML